MSLFVKTNEKIEKKASNNIVIFALTLQLFCFIGNLRSLRARTKMRRTRNDGMRRHRVPKNRIAEGLE